MRAIPLTALLCVAIVARGAQIDDELRAAQRLAWQKEFAAAEAKYRQVLRREPRSRDAALGLGQVLLWEQRYADAADVYGELVQRNASDVDARKGLATAEYWRGDFRAARRHYALVLHARPNDADARKALSDIAMASAPLVTENGEALRDDQPMRRARSEVAYTFFTDPLTKWTATAGAYALDADRIGLGRASAPFASMAVATALPSMQLRVDASLRLLRFPDGEVRPLGGIGLARDWRGSTFRIAADRHELLYTATSLSAHASETTLDATWSRGTNSAAALHAIRFFDGNRGRAADAYHLVPIVRSPRGSFSAGATVAYRDTDESRFRFIGASATAQGSGFAYSYVARYDPYWTPRALREARAVVAATVGVGRNVVQLHVDGGVARDRDLVFGPASGATRSVPLYSAPVEVARTFHPWRASADIVVPLRGGFSATAGFEHQTSAFYRSDAVRFGFSGRF
ncbi:MAG TPA: tetratricopeptide repeat protein [Thermoanaerobaculia bacterium]|nr:tetratricopeptide repeat protein [Thermoanaerobaculia bacterium]